MSPVITAVVATRNRPGPALDVVRDVLDQAVPGTSVVIVDQSDDRRPLREAVAALAEPRVTLIDSRTVGLPSARNEALAYSAAPIVWFLDDDARLRPGALAGHLAAYRDPAVGGVVGRIHERVVRPNARRTTNRLSLGGRVRTRLDGDAPCDVATLKGANMSFRRVALEAAGPCDPGYGGTAFLEDADWSTRVRRAGWRLRYAPDGAVDHLSLPAGGCRAPDPEAQEWWRFHNTGYFVRRLRPWSAPAVVLTFGLIAARRSFGWRSPAASARLMGALVRGWWDGAAGPRDRGSPPPDIG